MAESAQQATMTLATQKIKAYSPLLTVDTDDQSHIVTEFAAAAPGTDTLGKVKADLRLGVIACRSGSSCSYLAVC